MGLLPSPNYIKVLSGSGESKSKATSKAKSKAKSKEPGRTWTSSLVHDPALIHHECALTPGSILGGRSGCAHAALANIVDFEPRWACRRSSHRPCLAASTTRRILSRAGVVLALRIKRHAADGPARAAGLVDAAVEQLAEVRRLQEHVPVADAMDGDGEEEQRDDADVHHRRRRRGRQGGGHAALPQLRHEDRQDRRTRQGH